MMLIKNTKGWGYLFEDEIMTTPEKRHQSAHTKINVIV